MEAKAHLKYLRVSPRKVKILCDLIRFRACAEAAEKRHRKRREQQFHGR